MRLFVITLFVVLLLAIVNSNSAMAFQDGCEGGICPLPPAEKVVVETQVPTYTKATAKRVMRRKHVFQRVVVKDTEYTLVPIPAWQVPPQGGYIHNGRIYGYRQHPVYHPVYHPVFQPHPRFYVRGWLFGGGCCRW